MGLVVIQAASKQEFRRKMKVKIEGCGVEQSFSH